MLDEGSHVPAGTSQRLACDASRWTWAERSACCIRSQHDNRRINAAAVIKAMIEIRGEMDSADELAFSDTVAAQREAVCGVEFVRFLAPGKH